MSRKNWWARVWTLNDSTGEGAQLIPAMSKFWLEPVDNDGSLSFFYLRFEKGRMNECFKNMKLYPIGIRELHMSKLQKWNGDDQTVRETYMQEALAVRTQGYNHPQILRLEGTFSAPDDNDEMQREIARFYYLPAVEDGRDWFVFDIISGGKTKVQDGTGHGDED